MKFTHRFPSYSKSVRKKKRSDFLPGVGVCSPSVEENEMGIYRLESRSIDLLVKIREIPDRPGKPVIFMDIDLMRLLDCSWVDMRDAVMELKLRGWVEERKGLKSNHTYYRLRPSGRTVRLRQLISKNGKAPEGAERDKNLSLKESYNRRKSAYKRKSVEIQKKKNELEARYAVSLEDIGMEADSYWYDKAIRIRTIDSDYWDCILWVIFHQCYWVSLGSFFAVGYALGRAVRWLLFQY